MRAPLAHKKVQKARQPAFARHNANKKVRIKPAWRRPRGIHNKRRHAFRGYGPSVDMGYRSPRALRHAGPDGEPVIHITSPAKLRGLRPKSTLLVAGALGAKARLAVLEAADKAGHTVLNLDAAATRRRLADEFAARQNRSQDAKAKKKEEAARREKEAKKAEAPKPDAAAPLPEKTEEEKRAEDKREQDKILTKKDGGPQ